MPNLTNIESGYLLKGICEALPAVRIDHCGYPIRESEAVMAAINASVTALEDRGLDILRQMGPGSCGQLGNVMAAGSSRILRALPSQPTLSEEPPQRTMHQFLKWADASDLAEAVRCGLGFGEGIEHFLQAADKDPKMRDIIVNDMAPRSLARFALKPYWLRKDIFTKGRADTIADILKTQVEHFPTEFEAGLADRGHTLEVDHMKIFFVAGAKLPRPGSEKYQFKETRAFVEYVASNHGKLAASTNSEDLEVLIERLAATESPF